MDKKMEISPEGLLRRFSHQQSFNLIKNRMSTPQLSDALQTLVDYRPFIPGIKTIKDGYKILGKIITVQTTSNDWGTVLNAIDIAEKGNILFINSDNDDNAVWGGLTSKYAQKKKLAGTVVYGAVRDVGEIRKLNYPVFSKSIVPNAGAPKAEGEVNIPVQCGEITVKPKDVILADDCGVIVVPEEIFPQALEKTLQIKRDEKEIINKIESGYSLSDIVNLK